MESNVSALQVIAKLEEHGESDVLLLFFVFLFFSFFLYS